jgi:hypothetical protein
VSELELEGPALCAGGPLHGQTVELEGDTFDAFSGPANDPAWWDRYNEDDPAPYTTRPTRYHLTEFVVHDLEAGRCARWPLWVTGYDAMLRHAAAVSLVLWLAGWELVPRDAAARSPADR